MTYLRVPRCGASGTRPSSGKTFKVRVLQVVIRIFKYQWCSGVVAWVSRVELEVIAGISCHELYREFLRRPAVDGIRQDYHCSDVINLGLAVGIDVIGYLKNRIVA